MWLKNNLPRVLDAVMMDCAKEAIKPYIFDEINRIMPEAAVPAVGTEVKRLPWEAVVKWYLKPNALKLMWPHIYKFLNIIVDKEATKAFNWMTNPLNNDRFLPDEQAIGKFMDFVLAFETHKSEIAAQTAVEDTSKSDAMISLGFDGALLPGITSDDVTLPIPSETQDIRQAPYPGDPDGTPVKSANAS